MTLDQAKALRPGDIVHFRPCSIERGPRGGVKVTSTRARVNGQVKTWKRSPARVSVPVKRGLYEYGYISESNLVMWHTAAECAVPEARH